MSSLRKPAAVTWDFQGTGSTDPNTEAHQEVVGMCPALHVGEIRVTFLRKKQVIEPVANERIFTSVPRILI